MNGLRWIFAVWEELRAKERGFFAALAGLMVLGGFLEVVGLGALPFFFAQMVGESAGASLPLLDRAFAWAETTLGWTSLDVGAAFIVLIFSLQTVLLSVIAFAKGRFIARIVRRFSNDLFEGYLHAPLAVQVAHPSATISTRIIVETIRLANGVLDPLLRLAQGGVMVVAIAFLLLATSEARVLSVFAGVGVLALGILLAMRRRARRHGIMMTKKNAAMTESVAEARGALRHIRLRGLEPTLNTAFQENSAVRADSLGFQRFSGEVPKPLLEGLSVLGIVGLIFVLRESGQSPSAIIPTLGLMAVAVARLLPHINKATTALLTLQRNIYVAKTVIGALRDMPVPANSAAASPARAAGDIALTRNIAVRGLAYSYPGAETPSLQDITLDIPKNSAVAFVGPTGAGKSTLVDVIVGLLPPSSGHILIDDTDIADGRQAWQRHIGYIPQDVFLADRSLRENVALGLPRAEIDDARVWEVLRQAQVADHVAGLPKGLDTRVGENGVRLSGGQRQRIGIARALYHDPEVLVFDEATAALDNETERRLMQAIHRVRENRTLIMIAHRLSTIRECDRIFMMENGRVTGQGTYDELLADHAGFQALAA